MRSSFFSRKCFAGLIAGIVLAIPVMQAQAESTYVTEGSKAASLKSCVAPTNEIRRYHMDYMKHDRDEAVRDGDRTGEFSLAECVDCHAAADASGKYIPVNSEDQFCESCHDYVAVSLPCFQCHRTTPDEGHGKMGLRDLGQIQFQQLNASAIMDPHGAMGQLQTSLQSYRETDHEQR